MSRVKEKPPEDLQKSVKDVEGLDEEQLASANRYHDHRERKAWSYARVVGVYLLVAIGVALASGAAVGIIEIGIVAAQPFLADPARALAALLGLWDTLLVVGVSIFIDRSFFQNK